MRERAGLDQEDVAAALELKKERGSSVSNIETRTIKAPARKATIVKHATALKCQPWELLAGVATDLDRLRSQKPLSDEDLGVLLWSLGYLQPHQLRTALKPLQTLLDLIPLHARPKLNWRSAPAIEGRVVRTQQRKRSG